jgi:1,4-dihydroxy-2-naphthoate octaprenyltransferase
MHARATVLIAAVLALLAAPAARRPLELIVRTDGPGLVECLGATARLELLFGLLMAAGLWLAR